jgi:hypothetical protein
MRVKPIVDNEHDWLVKNLLSIVGFDKLLAVPFAPPYMVIELF